VIVNRPSLPWLRPITVHSVEMKWDRMRWDVQDERSLRLVKWTNWSVRSFSNAQVELASFKNEEIISRFEDATLHGDAASRVDVVSGHHSYRYAGPLTLANCVRHLYKYNTIQYKIDLKRADWSSKNWGEIGAREATGWWEWSAIEKARVWV